MVALVTKLMEQTFRIMYTALDKKDFEVIFDVLNVYNPNDISHVYPAMGDKEFLDGVQKAFRKVHKIVKLNNQCTTAHGREK